MNRAGRTVGRYIRVTFRAVPEDGQWASYCTELGTASCGETIDEALSNIAQATEQYLRAIEESGEWQRIFKKRNIPIYPSEAAADTRLITGSPREVVSSRFLPLRAAA